MMQPVPVDDVMLVYPGDVEHLMPDLKAIPDEYREWTAAWSCRLFNDVFFRGVKQIKSGAKRIAAGAKTAVSVKPSK